MVIVCLFCPLHCIKQSNWLDNWPHRCNFSICKQIIFAQQIYTFSQNKYLKTSHRKPSVLKQGKKNATFGPLASGFLPFTHCQKSISYFFQVQKRRNLRLHWQYGKLLSGSFPIRQKMPKTLYCNCQFSIRKKMTPSAPCRAAFSLYALTKTLINSSLVQKHRNIKLSVRKQEKTPPLGNFTLRFFSCTHCQKLYCCPQV